MAEAQLRSVLRKLQQIVKSQGGDWSLSDEQLLQAFLHRREAMAIEILVWRHGGMVLNLCRHILKDEHLAEDAFQATFLVFVRSAGTIGKQQSVGGWLHKVADRVARELWKSAVKQPMRSVHGDLSEFCEHKFEVDPVWRDTCRVLNEEIDLLPAKYRTAIVLCHLQGHTTAEAAELIGCPKKTVQSRLVHGREWLKSRLMRRGVALSVSWWSSQIATQASSPIVSMALVESTVQASVDFATRGESVGINSSVAMRLAQGVSHAMFMTKLKKVIATVLILPILALAAR